MRAVQLIAIGAAAVGVGIAFLLSSYLVAYMATLGVQAAGGLCP